MKIGSVSLAALVFLVSTLAESKLGDRSSDQDKKRFVSIHAHGFIVRTRFLDASTHLYKRVFPSVCNHFFSSVNLT